MNLLLGLTLVNVALIVAPLLVALPPVKQTPAMLAAARAAQVVAPMMSVALTITLAIRLWRKRTAGTLAVLLLAILCAVLSRINLLEFVFAGASGAETAAIGEFHDVRDTDMVIGVVIGGASPAHPLRSLSPPHM